MSSVSSQSISGSRQRQNTPQSSRFQSIHILDILGFSGRHLTRRAFVALVRSLEESFVFFGRSVLRGGLFHLVAVLELFYFPREHVQIRRRDGTFTDCAKPAEDTAAEDTTEYFNPP